MRSILPVAAAVAASILVVGSKAPDGIHAQPSNPPRQLFVLGDSLSDIGNAAAVADYLLGEEMHPEPTIGLCNPVERLLFDRDCEDVLYRRSRVSDGPVAVEHLAAHLGVAPFDASFHTVPDRPVTGANYSVAGGKARGDGPQDLAHQVDRLMLDQGLLLPAGSIVVVMIGGNDAIDALQAEALPELENPAAELADRVDPSTIPASMEPGEQIAADAVDRISTAVTRLLDAGASCVLVANVPDLGVLPAVGDAARENGIDEAVATAVAEEVATSFNTGLSERLTELAAAHTAGSALVQFDLQAVFDTVLTDAAVSGLNVADACFDSEIYAGSVSGRRLFHPECGPSNGEAPGFERFFFWDGIHPTGGAHAQLGAGLIEAYERGCGSSAMVDTATATEPARRPLSAFAGYDPRPIARSTSRSA